MAHIPPKITLKDLEDYSTVLEFRENPVLAAQLILNRDYDPQQALAVWGMWTHPYSMLDWGRGCGKCVAPETLIKLADGTEVRIDELFNRQNASISYEKKEWWAILDSPLLVKSYDKETKKFVDREVLTILKQKIDEDLYKITLVGGRTITCTKIHKILTSKGEWIEAQHIAHGDGVVCYSENGRLHNIKVEEINVIPRCEDYQYVYDLTVTDLKNYVGNGIVAHNTTMAADVEVLSAMLFPGTTSMVVSTTMKGAKLVFDELIKTWLRSGIVKDSTPKRPTKGNDLCEMIFNSMNLGTGQQTNIKGIAADVNNDGSSIRGNRVNRCLHIDEWIFLPQDLINGAIMPCASTTDDVTRPEYDLNLTRFMFTCSSGYTYMEAYKRMETFRKFFMFPEKYAEFALDRDGKPQYFYHNMNYEKMTKKGILNLDNIKMWKATFPVQKFSTEVLAKWESESGSWYNAKSIKGDPENPTKERGIWVKASQDSHAKYLDRDRSGDYIYILAVDFAERQDESGFALIRVTPNKLYIAETIGYKHTTQEECAEIIREYMDKYEIHTIVMDPGGGGTGVGNYLKVTKIRMNTYTNKMQPFFPIYPMDDKWLNKKGESIPAGARRMLEYITFSSTSGLSNLTDLNTTLRSLIEGKALVVADDGPEEFTERVRILMDQIIAIEAEHITTTAKNKEKANQAADKGRYSFISRILKDRWAALLIGVHQSMIVQAELNMVEEEEDPGVYLLPNIYDQFGGYDY